jgi:hypothetical protein
VRGRRAQVPALVETAFAHDGHGPLSQGGEHRGGRSHCDPEVDCHWCRPGTAQLENGKRESTREHGCVSRQLRFGGQPLLRARTGQTGVKALGFDGSVEHAARLGPSLWVHARGATALSGRPEKTRAREIMAAHDVVFATETQRPEARAGEHKSRGASIGRARAESGTSSPGGTLSQHTRVGTVVPPTTRVFNTAAGPMLQPKTETERHGSAAPHRQKNKKRGMPGPRGYALLPLLMLPHAAAYESPYDPTCAAAAPPQQVTLQGDSTGPWEDITFLNSHGGDELVGAAYAHIPPMSLLPGDKLAFDTSVLGTDAMNVTLSLASCVPTRTVGSHNSEDGLTYTCEETLMPEHTVSLSPRPPPPSAPRAHDRHPNMLPCSCPTARDARGSPPCLCVSRSRTSFSTVWWDLPRRVT